MATTKKRKKGTNGKLLCVFKISRIFSLCYNRRKGQNMKELNSPFIFQSIIDEDGEINYEWAEAAEKIANQENIGITRDREIDSVVLDENGHVIAGTWISWDGDNYEFDVVVSKEHQGKGIGSYLIDRYINIPEEYMEINPETTMNLHIVNEKLKDILFKKGFDIKEQHGKENYTMSKSSDNSINSFLKQKINEENDLSKPKSKKPKFN